MAIRGATNATRLANEIMDHLRTYEATVRDEINLSAQEVGKEAVKELKAIRKFKNPSTHYWKGWTLSKVGKRAVRYVVNNKTDYQLTHLLEKGHALRNGGRVQAYPHIGQVEQKAISKFLDEVERVIKQ